MRASPPRLPPRLAAASLALALAACAQKPSAATCSSHAQCPAGTTCQSGVCQEGLALALTAPAAATTYTSAGVPVQVTVDGGTPGAVTLLVDDVPVATFSVPFSGTLDTSSLSEGSHVLVAVVESGGRTFRSAPRTIHVDRTAPAAPAVASAITNAADPVTVTGTWTPDAGTPVTLTVYEGATVLGSGIVPSGGAWGAAFALAEGVHQLTARAVDAAGNASGLSAPGTITVDRTPPTVAATLPDATGGIPGNVWSRDPIVVTFSEAVRPATLTAANVTLTAGAAGAVTVLSRQLSVDGRTLTVTPDPNVLPPVPARWTLTLGPGILDLAGNPLAATQLPTTVSWDVPEWQAPFTYFRPSGLQPYFDFAVAPGGKIWVAYTYKAGSNPSPFVRFQDPATNTALPTINYPANTWPPPPQLVIDGTGKLVVKTYESANIVVRTYDGTSWVPLGAPLPSSTTGDIVAPAVDPLLVATTGASGVTVLQWSGSAWTTSTQGSYPGLYGIGALGRPAWVAGTATSVRVAGVLPALSGTAFAAAAATLNASNLAVLATIDSGALAGRVQVKGSPIDQWSLLGSTQPTTGTKAYAVYRPSGAAGEQVVIASCGSTFTSAVELYGLSGTTWTPLPGTGAGFTPASYAPLGVRWSTDGILAVGWTHFVSTDYLAIYVRRYNR